MGCRAGAFGNESVATPSGSYLPCCKEFVESRLQGVEGNVEGRMDCRKGKL
jgi:hypothetical protein